MSKAITKTNWITLIIFIVICQLTGMFGSAFTAPSIPTWYVFLNKPFFTPPSWLFAPVWILLYTLMGISAYRVWVSSVKTDEKHIALRFFFIQLSINLIWSLIFFGLKNLTLALVDIFLLLIFLVITIAKFQKIDKVSGYLLYPYFAWGAFATVLNLAIVFLN